MQSVDNCKRFAFIGSATWYFSERRHHSHKKTPAPDEGSGRFRWNIEGLYFELEIKLAWVAPFLILLCLIQLMVERSLAPTFSIWWAASALRMALKRL